ncbi:MAG: M1 family metallopeptidase [Woeseiaceae bacterium]|nr:M1 family metallopeptidase [Woeseiaceae bacterium]
MRTKLFAAAAVALLAAAAQAIPESPITYTIEAELDPVTRELTGRETITWKNTLEVAVASVPMHLYLNAFSNEASSWHRYSLRSRFLLDSVLERFDDPWGWNEPESIRQDGVELEWRPIAPNDGNALDRTLIEVSLAEPVAPGDTLALDVEWTSRLPAAAARTGGYDTFFMVAQWFPKIAGVRPDGTFNRHQFFGPTEFFANFADFDVTMGLPSGWGVASTGDGGLERSSDGVDWHRFRQEGVIDFAFATGRDMRAYTSTHTLVTGGDVDITIFQPQGLEHQLPRWTGATAVSLDTMSRRIMPYPYETVTVVLPPRAGIRAIGMEYPTLFTGAPGGDLWDKTPLRATRINEMVIAHEFAHQYFMGLVATNEFEDAFMDEGMTEYWTAEIVSDEWGEYEGLGSLFGRTMRAGQSSIRSESNNRVQPAIWSGPSFLARGYSPGLQFYDRPQTTFQTAARLFGQDAMDAVFSEYTKRWSFRHPRVEDFWAVAEEVGGTDMAAMLREAYVHPETPDYRVASVEAEAYEAPRGYVATNDGTAYVNGDWDGDELLGLPAEAAETEGDILVEILDPGHTRDTRTMGSIERRWISPVRGKRAAGYIGDDNEYFVSEARVEGPDWDHLPVTVELRFADGLVVEDEWDGKGLYRHYRVVRPAPLDSVIIDPDYKIRVDTVPVNNGLSRKPSGPVPGSWSKWLTAVFQLLAEGASSWL